MELEEMKTLWAEMSAAVEKQKKITDSIIIKMTRSNYRNKINKIRVPEFIGSFLCMAGAALIVFNFRQLTPWYLAVCGILACLVLVLLSFLSVIAIRSLQRISITDNNYREALLAYAKGRLQFVRIQKINFCLAALLMVTILPVIGELINGQDVFKKPGLWLSYAVLFPFFYWVSTWVFHKYLKIINDAETILKELGNNG